MAVNPNNLLGQSNPNGTVGVSLGIDPAGANEAFSAGATSGFYVTPTSPAGMSVQVGGAVGVVDSALVRSASGITFPVGNVTGTPITLTVPAAPSTNSRIDSVVLYVDTSVTATATDGANAVGIEIVSGTSASSPVPPTEQQIRSAIQDGASIAYTVLANITVSSSTSTITASNISQANRAQLAADKIDFATTQGSLNMANHGDFNGTLYYTKTQEGLVFLKGALTKKSGNVVAENAIFSTSTPIITPLRPQSQRVWIFAGSAASTIKTALNANGAMVISVVNGTTNNVQICATYGLYG